jgi:hypothetical protein
MTLQYTNYEPNLEPLLYFVNYSISPQSFLVQTFLYIKPLFSSLQSINTQIARSSLFRKHDSWVLLIQVLVIPHIALY